MAEITKTSIESMIYIIRGQKVMRDSDLASLYGVETRIINRNVKRNIERFPDDFMFQLTKNEYQSLISQFGISKTGRGGRQKLPYVFTELGIAMLSSVLNSKTAIAVNISIMRIFIKLRSNHLLEKELTERMNKLEIGTNQIFKIVFERLDEIDETIKPKLAKHRRKIAL